MLFFRPRAVAPRGQPIPRAPRVRITVAVRHRGAGEPDAVVDEAQDISATGLFVACEEPYTVGTAVELEVPLPGGERKFEAVGRVVRVGVGACGRHGMGIMFLAVDDASRSLLDRIVRLAIEAGGAT